MDNSVNLFLVYSSIASHEKSRFLPNLNHVKISFQFPYIAFLILVYSSGILKTVALIRTCLTDCITINIVDSAIISQVIPTARFY